MKKLQSFKLFEMRRHVFLHSDHPECIVEAQSSSFYEDEGIPLAATCMKLIDLSIMDYFKASVHKTKTFQTHSGRLLASKTKENRQYQLNLLL